MQLGRLGPCAGRGTVAGLGGVHTLAPRHPATSDARRLGLAKWSAVPVSTAERRGDEVSSLGAGLNPRGRGGEEPGGRWLRGAEGWHPPPGSPP